MRLLHSILLVSLSSLAVANFHSKHAHIPKQFQRRVTSESDVISTSWYAGWHSTLEYITWSKFDQVNFAFLETSSDVTNLTFTNGTDATTLVDFVTAAHQNDVKAKATIGGWTGSIYFSSAVATAENRTAFVKTVLDFAQNYSLDGIDFDWEYPASQGIGCNTLSTNDTDNFLAFLQELRADSYGSTLILSAATGLTPYVGSDGSPSTNVSAFSSVLDYITIMNYDVWGSWSATVGPNAPLNDTCAPSADQMGSAVYGVQSWTAAGMPVDQIVLAVPTYGHSFSVSNAVALLNGTDELALYPVFDATVYPAGDVWDDQPGVDICGVATPQGGIMDFWALIEDGYLDSQGNNVSNVPYVYDTCSQTPYVYNTTTEVMISFDNAESFSAKGQFIKDYGLGGFALWQNAGDYNDILLDAIIKTAFDC